jgi:hypothetical protein
MEVNQHVLSRLNQNARVVSINSDDKSTMAAKRKIDTTAGAVFWVFNTACVSLCPIIN